MLRGGGDVLSPRPRRTRWAPRILLAAAVAEAADADCPCRGGGGRGGRPPRRGRVRGGGGKGARKTRPGILRPHGFERPFPSPHLKVAGRSSSRLGLRAGFEGCTRHRLNG